MKYPLILSTGTRSVFYTKRQLHHLDSLKRFLPDPQAELDAETAKRYNVENGEEIIIETDRGAVRMRAGVSDRVAEGVVLVPQGRPGEANANLLPDARCREPITGCPQWKGLLRSIRKAGARQRALCRYCGVRPLCAFGKRGVEKGMALKKRHEFVFQSVGPFHHL